MCGINGFTFADEKIARAMNKKIKHRGPDDEGIFIDKNFSLSMVRLAILDPSKKGAQPMKSDDGRYVIVHNGEVYNFKSIRDELEFKGISFSSNSDTEVILKAYITYGEECVRKFNGMFAFAIWDVKAKELFVARDHAGIKPFYYFYDGNNLIFSSEIKSILLHKVTKEIDMVSFNSFLRFSYINGPETIFKNIFSLSPGHTLKYKNNNLIVERYWEIPLHTSPMSFMEGKESIRAIFDNAVKDQLVSDKPLGIFLGGGIDSTAILGSMTKCVSEKIKTFSVRFETDVQGEKFNEDSDVAKKTAHFYDTDHHEISVSGKDVVEHFEDMVYHLDSLTANNSIIAPYLLSKYTKEHVDVVLGGDGGDELFGGYERYYHLYIIEKFQIVPQLLRKNPIAQIIANVTGNRDYYVRLNASLFDLFLMYRAQKEATLLPLLKEGISDYKGVKKRLAGKHFKKLHSDYATHLMGVDFSTWLVDEALVKNDALTMASGLEQRVPILDKRMVELALSIPPQHKINSRTQGKHIFKEAVHYIHMPHYQE